MLPTLDPATLQPVRDLLPEAERSAFISAVIGAFVTDMEAQLRALHTAVSAGDVGACSAIAHGMRGACGGIGAVYLMYLCAKLETAAREGIFPPLGTYLAQIEAEYGCLMRALEREHRQEA